jgi:hypothetical protein
VRFSAELKSHGRSDGLLARTANGRLAVLKASLGGWNATPANAWVHRTPRQELSMQHCAQPRQAIPHRETTHMVGRPASIATSARFARPQGCHLNPGRSDSVTLRHGAVQPALPSSESVGVASFRIAGRRRLRPSDAVATMPIAIRAREH